jgi:hypothetical protein
VNRIAFIATLLALAAPTTLAEPLTLPQLKLALSGQGGEALEMDQRDGWPVLTGDMQGQPFSATLGDCQGPQQACESVRFVACRDLPDHSRIEALEIANTYNTGDGQAVAYADEAWFGQTLCIRLQQSFPGAQTFGVTQISAWKIELGDFLQRVEDALEEKRSANLLDNGAD